MVIKDSIIESIIHECLKKIPPKQTKYIESFEKMEKELSEDINTDIAAKLCMILVRPEVLSETSDIDWKFRIDEALLGIFDKLISRGLLTSNSFYSENINENEVKRFNVLAEIISAINSQIDIRLVSNSCQIKLVQLLLTAATISHGSLQGPLLCIALDKLALVLVRSNQPVNQNAAKAAIVQIVKSKIETEGVDLDRSTVFEWLCNNLKNKESPIHLTTLLFDLVKEILSLRSQMFKGGDLSGTIELNLFPAVMEAISRNSDPIFSQLLDVISLLIRDFREQCREIIEIFMMEIFSTPVKDTGSTSPNTKAPLLRPHLRSWRNKQRSAEFMRDEIFSNPEILFFFFQNYDSDLKMASIIETLCGILQLFIKIDWHNSEGNRIPGSIYTDRCLRLKFTATEALLAMQDSIILWSKSGMNNGLEQNMRTLYEFMKIDSLRKQSHVLTELFNDGKIEQALEEAVLSGFILDESSSNKALWLRLTRGLDKKIIGDYLGSSSNMSLLSAFVDTFDFEALSFVKALRLFLESFRIPGEAQVIERFLDSFSVKYFESGGNDEFKNPDVIFQVAYSTLMLNTDMYSTSVRNKMSKEDFLHNTLRAIDEDLRPDEEVLAFIYEEISHNEIQLQTTAVAHPLPLNSRTLLEPIVPTEGDLVAAFLYHVSLQLSTSLSYLIEKIYNWPPNRPFDIESPLFSTQQEVIECVLDHFYDFIGQCCVYDLQNEKYKAMEIMFQTKIFKSESDLNRVNSSIEGSDNGLFDNRKALQWLIDLCHNRANDLCSGWLLCLKVMSEWDLSALVDENHNFIEIDIARLDGIGIVWFTEALLSIPFIETNSKIRMFIQHYSEKLCQMPASSLERVIKYCYEGRKAESCGKEIFALLGRAAENELMGRQAFSLLQRAAREQMPLVISISNVAMFDFLQSIEKFALRGSLEIGKEAVDTLVLIGDILYSQHCSGSKTAIPVNDEEFFLRWYNVLLCLSRVAIEQSNQSISSMASSSLFKLCRDHGSCYQEGAWRVIWRSILLPLLEEMRSFERDKDGFFCKLIDSSVQLISQYQQILFSSTLHDVFDNVIRHLECLARNINGPNHSEEGIRLLKDFISKTHAASFTEHHWTIVTDTLMRIFESLKPSKSLTEYSTGSPLSILQSPSSTVSIPGIIPPSAKDTCLKDDFNSSGIFPQPESNTKAVPLNGSSNLATSLDLLARQCALQLLAINSIKQLTVEEDENNSILGRYSKIPFSSVKTLLLLLMESFQFTLSFNSNIALRTTLVKHGMAETVEQVVLNAQETGSLNLLDKILYGFVESCLSKSEDTCVMLQDTHVQQELTVQYLTVSEVIMKRFIELKQQSSNYHRKIGKSWNELASNTIKQWKALGDTLSRSKYIDLNNSIMMKILKAQGDQVAIALEICAITEGESGINAVSKDFVTNLTKGLLQYTVASLQSN